MPALFPIKPRGIPWRILLFFTLTTIAITAPARHWLRGGSTKDSHPLVPGFERFFAKNQNASAVGGQLLLGELNCISCHKPDVGQETILYRRQAPILDHVADRVRISYLRKFLSDPQAVKPGTTMPHLFVGISKEEKEQRVEELVHFLASTGSPVHQGPDRKQVALGRQLYERVGCIACHGTRDAAGKQDKLLPTSVPLGDLKAKTTIPALAAFLQDPHQVRSSGRMPTLLNPKEAQAVAHFLLQGLPYSGTPANMKFAYYEGTWDRLPDFSKLTPRLKGEAAGFDLSLALRPNNFALTFEGYLKIIREGTYRFILTSDDGSKLLIDGKTVVNNDGVHAPTTAFGTAKLPPGMHPILVSFFQGPGGVELHVDIEGPGLKRQPVAPLVFLTPKGNSLPKKEEKTEDSIIIKPALAEKGRQTFLTLGCASCHNLTINGKLLVPNNTPPALAKMKTVGGCLASEPAKGLPNFSLSKTQRSDLASALKALTNSPAKLSAKEIIARTMTTFNCYACHERDKVGGVEEGLNKSFTTAQPEMGDEGRIPPPLDGVGAKLNPIWLKKILDQGSQERPYMHTRMPAFGIQNVGQLVQAFAKLDTNSPVTKPQFKEPITKIKASARHMVGGLGMGCIKCHTFGGRKAEGIQAIDMTIMVQRLNHDWFHRYLLDPQKIRALTRMPSAWPMGQSTLPDVLGGDAVKQIEAIWLYLSDGNKAVLPVGLGSNFIPLIPEDEAIIYRNFIEGGGTRAIGVGYPERANLAFDANDMRLAMIWQGGFIDAARHWTNRGEGFQVPLGDNVLKLPPGPTFTILEKDNDPWPTKPAKDLGYHFRGYRLTPDQRPTFRYSFGEIDIEDFPNAVEGKPSPIIRRKLSLTAKQGPANLWLRAAMGSKIVAGKDGWFVINNEWRMRIESVAQPIIRSSAGQQELLVRVRFENNRATIVQEIVW
jgi:mono/diheme cytochrome c family protein